MDYSSKEVGLSRNPTYTHGRRMVLCTRCGLLKMEIALISMWVCAKRLSVGVIFFLRIL
jgi:hypothetical protein